ncbi:cationic amino acid transporter 1 [Quercus suber]|uniref:Cationic amino acid transporter 1 n=1 Tax=Quercus suber TaxID=58331 RepID=A0AAW0KI04_QUESU
MKKTLTSWDLIWFGIGAVIGAGIFVLTGLEAQQQQDLLLYCPTSFRVSLHCSLFFATLNLPLRSQLQVDHLPI